MSTDQQKAAKAARTLINIATYYAMSKLMSTAYDRQYSRGIRKP